MSINNRVVQLIDKTSSSKTAFSEATGISNVILSHISSGRNKVSLTAVEQILKAFPNVSADWLVLGKGKMFKDGIDAQIEDELMERLERLSSDFERLKKSVSSNIDGMRDKIKSLSA